MIKVMVSFDDGIPDDLQAKAMFDMELFLRSHDPQDIRVLKDRMADDSKLRVVMDMRRKK
jgi:hypothetical protein